MPQAVLDDALFQVQRRGLVERVGDARQRVSVSHRLLHVPRVQREVRARTGAGRRQRRHLLHDALPRAAGHVFLDVHVGSCVGR